MLSQCKDTRLPGKNATCVLEGNCWHFHEWLWRAAACSVVSPKHPYSWHYIFYLCQHLSKKKQTHFLFSGIPQRAVQRVCLCVWLWGITVGKLTWGAAQTGRFDWTPWCARACFIAEWIKSSQQLTQGVLSLHWVLFIHLRCRENNKAECYMALPRSLQRYITKPSPACRDFYSLRRPRSALTVGYES